MPRLTTTVGIYILGWLTVVPFCCWQLCTNATRENLALLIMVPVGWIFCYFPTVMPLLTAWKIRRLMRLLDDPEQLIAMLRKVDSGAGRERVVEFMARENRVPKFVIRWLYDRLQPYLQRVIAQPTVRTAGAAGAAGAAGEVSNADGPAVQPITSGAPARRC